MWNQQPVILNKSLSEESSVSGENHWNPHMVVADDDDINLKLFMQNFVNILNIIIS